MAEFGAAKIALLSVSRLAAVVFKRPLALAPLGAACLALLVGAAARPAANPFDQYVPLLGVGDRVPTTAFVDQRGRPAHLADFRGKTVILGFIYTNCTDACPIISAKFRGLQAALGNGRFHLVEVSVDPERDTPAVIRRYARRFHADPARWSILTGQPARLAPFWRAMGESVIRGAGGAIIHNDRTIVIAPDGTVADVIDEAGWSVAEMAAQAQFVAGNSGSVIERADLALGKAAAFVCGGFQSGHAGLADLIGTIGILGAFGLVLYLAGKKIYSLPG